MLSFIIIGRNEGWKLTKCLNSVIYTVKYNQLSNFEIIYVDSNSNDDSIDRAKIYNEVKIVKLTGSINAAIARNIGAKEANGNVLFFIDGDMELIPEFISLVYSEREGLINDFVSGNWMNYYYERDILVAKSIYLKMEEDLIEKVTGGLFLINRSIWEKNGGMRNIFKKSQDIDLGLRLAKQNIFLFRKNIIAAKHHTIAYMDKNRMWKDLFRGNEFYGRSLLYRSNMFNKYSYYRLFRNDYSLVFLAISLIGLFFFPRFILFYLSFILLKSIWKFKYRFFPYFIYFILRDLFSLIGIFFFIPKQYSQIDYIIVK